MIRCLIVDDSPTFRKVLRNILASAPGVQVVGEAADGAEAVQQTLALKPDVITMDVQMPRKDGLEAITEIMKRLPTPIVVVSAAAAGDDVTFRALEAGAVDVVEKPGADAVTMARRSEEIRQAVRAVAGLTLVTRHERTRRSSRELVGGRTTVDCIGIASSTGGPAALAKILSGLPPDFDIPILVVQHIAEGFVDALVRWLQSQCALQVKVAERGEEVVPGKVLVAPTGKHLMVSLGRVRLDDALPVRGFKPSGTVLFTAMAREYGANAAGLILTGMGTDGAAGLRLIRQRGGVTLAQGEASSVVFGMPREALESGAAEIAVELEEIVPVLRRLAGDEVTEVNLAAALATTPGTRKRLLLVDDAETILKMETLALKDAYDLVVARNGLEGLEAATREKPDGILMDYSMPVMTGGEALRALRKQDATRKIPVIMVTSETDPTLLKSCWDDGCQAIIRKPIDRAMLLQTVRRFVGA